MRVPPIAVSLALAATFGTPQALGYCRTMSCQLTEDPKVPTCERDEKQCVIEGQPVHWPSPCLPYAVQLDGSPKFGLSADEVADLAAQAFDVWTNATCPGGGHPRFEAVFQGFVSCEHHETLCAKRPQNVSVILFHDEDWPHEPTEIGVTLPAGSIGSGLLVDADIELNSRDFDFSGAPEDPFLLSVLAHEVGHFLGIHHNPLRADALMFNDYRPRSAEMLLDEDDIAAICAIYPPWPLPLSCADSSPAYDMCQREESGLDEDCTLAVMPSPKSGCACSQVRGTHSGAAWLAALWLAFVWFGRRTTASRAITRQSVMLVGRGGAHRRTHAKRS